MIISNNIAAQTILNESNRNLKKSSKLAEKLSTGTKITSAGDDAAGYTISERMRVKLRALNQDDNNVKSGKDMLTVASGAVQSQMNILRTIKERVIDANNDTNTDTDRKIIQREIDEYYDQMSIIAYDTDFNGEKLLVGGKVDQVVESWEIYDHAVMAEDSEIPGLLPDATEPTLDKEPDPFATFGKDTDNVQWDGYNKIDDPEPPESWAECAASNTNGANFVGGTRGNSRIIEVDLSSYNSTAALDNISFRITADGIIPRDFVLTTDTSRNYQRGEKIDISGCNTADDIVARIKATADSVQEISDAYDITVSGAKITFTTKKDGENTNTKYDITGQKINEADITNEGHSSAPSTRLTLINFSGGKDAVTHTENIKYQDPQDPDRWIDSTKTVTDVPATNATCTINGISNVAAGSGITINGLKETYLIFADDSSSLAYDDIKHCYTIGKNFSGNFSLEGIGFELSGNTLKATAETAGSWGNNFSFTDGVTGKADVTIHYTAAQELTGISVTQKGTNGNRAHWDMDLSDYNNTDATKAEELIKKYLGKTIGIDSANIEFIDSGSSAGMDALYKITTNTIDLNNVRTAVAGGTTAAEAFKNLLAGKMNTQAIKAADGAITGIKIWANTIGEEGNSEKMVSQTGELRHYTIDWQKWVDTQNITDIPAALHEKGIRFYCPTDGSQWVNVRFVNGMTDNDDDRPDSGTNKQDIKTLTIDVAGITDTKGLVEKINDELGDYLANTYKHNFLLASDPASGTTTIYDRRRYTVRDKSGYALQEKGAKIGTGIMDNVIKSTRNVLVNEVIIQHTDKANMNIHLKIPQTSLDHIFGYKTSMRDISEYNVMTSDMREKLLGVPPKKGILDRGIQYLTDAQTLIGAQVNHLEVAKNNIDTQNENLTASEPVIRDADMAATMVEFTKYNILGQASQSMLAQANQLPQRILELLQ